MINMVCLDTSFLADLLRQDEKAISKMEQFIEDDALLVTTPINVSELYKGAYGFHNPEEEVDRIEQLLYQIPVLPMNNQSCKLYGMIHHLLKSSGRPIPDRDILIACICLGNNIQKLATRDVKHFKNIPELIIEEY